MSVTTDFEFDVFLSHSSKDKATVRNIAERLRSDGLKVWFDEWVIKPGDSIPSKIEEGLEHSRVLVLCMSSNAFGSDWAQLEYQTFRFRDPLNKSRRFIPLRLDEAPIKGSLSQFLYINWRPVDREEEYAKLLEACSGGERTVGIKKQAEGGWSLVRPEEVVIDRDSRDDFSVRIKDTLARRVGMQCSNPYCRRTTSGPQSDPNKSVNIGVAAHITAASARGPRYVPTLSKRERSSIENGIWLCQNCAKLVDSDEKRFTVELLRQWKKAAEDAARQGVETSGNTPTSSQIAARISVHPYATVARPDNECSILLRERLYREDFEEGSVICPPAWDNITETLSKQKIVAVEAPPGSGKSTLAAWVGWKLSRDTYVEYFSGRNFQNSCESALTDELNSLTDETVVLLDDAHLVQSHLDYLMRSSLASRMRFLFLSRPRGFSNILGIPAPIDLSGCEESIAQEMANRYTATPEEAKSLLSKNNHILVLTKWLLGAMEQNPLQCNLTLESTVLTKLKEFWDSDKELLRLVLVLSAYRWLELQCFIDNLTEKYGFTTETIDSLCAKLYEAVLDSGSKSIFLDRHPILAWHFHKVASKFQYYTRDVLKPTCDALEIDHSTLRDFTFGSVVLGAAVVNGSLHAMDVRDRLLFSFHSDCPDFSRAAAHIDLQVNPAVECLDTSTIERRLIISFAAYDAMRREHDEKGAWDELTILREKLGVADSPTTNFESKGYLLYQVGYHYVLTNQLEKALGFFEKAAEADDLWAKRMNSDIHLGKAAMSRIMAVRAKADVLMATSTNATDPSPNLKEIANLARKLEAERIRLEYLISEARGIDWSWLQRWHLNALIHLAELHGCLGKEDSVESLVREAIDVAPAINETASTDQSATRAKATLAFYQGHFDTVVELLQNIEIGKAKSGELSGRLAQLLALSYRKLGNPAQCKRWCQWLAEKCPVDKANGPSVEWAKAVLKSSFFSE